MLSIAHAVDFVTVVSDNIDRSQSICEGGRSATVSILPKNRDRL